MPLECYTLVIAWLLKAYGYKLSGGHNIVPLECPHNSFFAIMTGIKRITPSLNGNVIPVSVAANDSG